MNTNQKECITKIINELNDQKEERKKLIKIYCDESCHLQNDKSNILVLGALFCPESKIKEVKNKFNDLKKKYYLKENHEIKYTNVSLSKLNLYIEIINLIFEYELNYYAYGLYHFDKEKLSKKEFDHIYYNLYENMLDKETDIDNCYKIYIDRKDTKGFNKIKELNNHLCESKADFNHSIILSIDEVESHLNPLIQLSDLVTGIVGLYMKIKFEKKDIKTIGENKLFLLLHLLQHLKKNEEKFIKVRVMDMSN